MDKLKWETVEYPIADFAPEGKVITQRDVLEKYKAEHPNDEVKTFSSFKYNHQNRTVSLRIAIADNTPTYGGSLKSIAEDIERAKTVEGLKNQLRCSNDVFLGSEKNYLELKEKYDALYIVHEELKVELEQTRITLFADEDSADLAEAKKAIAEGSGISLDEIEDAVENKEPVTEDEKCDCCGNDDCGEVEESDENADDTTSRVIESDAE